MADEERLFDYVAISPSGQRVKGSVSARSDGGAFEKLRREGLSPLTIRFAKGRSSQEAKPQSLSDRDCAEFLSSLSILLKAGANMRAALSILGSRSDRPALRSLCRLLTAQIGGGDAMDQAFARNLSKRQAFVAALIAAGEAAGDLAGGFERASEMLGSRIKLRDQIVSVLSYPAFVFASTIAAILVILLFIVPTLAPIAEDNGATPPLAMALLIGASDFLQANLLVIGVVTITFVVAVAAAGALGLLTEPMDRLTLDGPVRKTAGALIYGAFAIALGNMLAAGAPMSDALRLAIRSVRSGLARGRLEIVAQSVRQGQPLSNAVERVAGFPSSITRLAAVGEASGALGAMLARAGKLEEDAAIRRIEAAGRLLGPALIVALGGIIGLLMAGLLSGVTQLGQAALR